jgi:cell division protein ZapA (FtsZ GTPase activity inhibitor)
MSIENLTYFETIDVDKRLGEAYRDAKGLLWTVNILHDMLKDTEHAAGLNALAEALETSDALMDGIWEQITSRQAEIEEAELAEQEELELAMA